MSRICPVATSIVRYYQEQDDLDRLNAVASECIDAADLEDLVEVMSDKDKRRFRDAIASLCYCNQNRDEAVQEIRRILWDAAFCLAKQQIAESYAERQINDCEYH